MRRLALLAILVTACVPASWGAGALLHPSRRPLSGLAPALAHRDLLVDVGGVALRGWVFPPRGPARGITVVYLHGIADNRASGVWLAERLVPHGLEVVVFDARAHGASGGDACTYGFHEKRDVARVLDAVGARRAVLVGASLGGAVALQAAAEDARIAGVVAAAAFADLPSIARERAPWFASDREVRAAIAEAERLAGFRADEVSPVRSAARIRVPVLVVHGLADRQIAPSHARRLHDALAGPKRLVLLEGVGHDEALGAAWAEAEAWVLAVAGGG